MSKNYYYKVYGMNIKSEFEIKELVSIDELAKIDIEIKEDNMPERIKEEVAKGQFGGGNKEEIWFYGPDAGIYRICNGNKIYVELLPQNNPYYTNIYLTCSCMGFIMYQREKIAIHGGTIVVNNKAIILTGDKGAGKSTLTTAFREKGYKVISDDVAAIDFKEVPLVNHGIPYQKLCTDAMDKLGYKKEEYFSFLSDTEVKYVVPIKDQFVYEDTELYGIFEIVKGDVKEVIIEEVTGVEKLKKVMKNIYRSEFFSVLGGVEPSYVKKCLNLAKELKVYKIIRPNDKFTVTEQIKLIEEKLL